MAASTNHWDFRSEVDGKDLKQRSIRGGTVTMAAQGCKFLLTTATTMMLARLLTPQDYGLFGMVTAITGFITIFQDLGLSTATVQAAVLDHRQVTALFWINLGIGVLLAVLLAFGAPLIAWFYHEPRLISISLWLAAGFVLGGLMVQHQALLKRQMRFTLLAIIDISALITSALAGVICAWRGAGYWSLVWMQLVGGLVLAAGSWLGCHWRPGPPKGVSTVRPMLRFGGNLAGFQVVNYFGRNADNVLIGKYWGPDQLGVYARAYSLLLLPLGQITGPAYTVMLPALSRVQGDPERFRRAFLRYLSAITCVTMPLVVFCIALCNEIIQVALGPRWSGAVPLFRVLGLAGLIQVVTSPCGILFIAVGRTDRMFRLGVVSTLFTLIAFLIGLPHGAMGVAVSYAVYSWLAALPIVIYACGLTAVTLYDVGKTMVRPAILSAAVGLALAVLHFVWPAEKLLLARLSVAGILAALIWLGIICSPGYDSVNPIKLFLSGFRNAPETSRDGV